MALKSSISQQRHPVHNRGAPRAKRTVLATTPKRTAKGTAKSVKSVLGWHLPHRQTYTKACYSNQAPKGSGCAKHSKEPKFARFLLPARPVQGRLRLWQPGRPGTRLRSRSSLDSNIMDGAGAGSWVGRVLSRFLKAAEPLPANRLVVGPM